MNQIPTSEISINDTLPTEHTIPSQNKTPHVVMIFVIAVVFVFLGYFVFRQFTHSPKLGAVVSYVEGDVEYQKNDSGWKTALPEQALSEGMMVRVLSSGKAIVNFDDGSAIRLNANARIRIDDLSPDHIVVINDKGEVYTRVSKSKRTFLVKAQSTTYQAMGTAFKTVNDENKQGVEVYESQVKILGEDGSDELLVDEGSRYYLVDSDSPDRVNSVIAMNIEDIKKDEFILWNTAQDEKQSEFKSSLGVLMGISASASAIANDIHISPTSSVTPSLVPTKKLAEPSIPKKTKESSAHGTISLSATTSEKGIHLKWVVTDMDSNLGFKVIKNTEANPVYPGNDYKYLSEPTARETVWEIRDGKEYHFRVCKYLGDACGAYSNDITAKAPSGDSGNQSATIRSISLKSDGGSKISWTVDGNSPSGFKVVWSKNSSPVYPNRDGDQYHYYSEPGKRDDTLQDFSGSGMYYVRVCEYLGGACGVYSNQIEINL